MSTRHCETCGEPFMRRTGENERSYQQRRSCSRACWRRTSNTMRSAHEALSFMPPETARLAAIWLEKRKEAR